MQKYYWDPLRRKEVPATPEELVRQSFIEYLNKELGYTLSLMASEYSTTYNGRTYRADIVLFNRSLKPVMIVECKAPSVKIDSNVVSQVLRYNLSFGGEGVETLVVTNGKTTCAMVYNREEKCYRFVEQIPEYISVEKDK